MLSTRSGPRQQYRCHNCGEKMALDFGNLCPDCKEPKSPAPSLGCSILLAVAAVAVAMSVWFLN